MDEATAENRNSTLSPQIPCMSACPVQTWAGRYVQLIARGEYREAYRIARQNNPFASICGRICEAPCEAACHRAQVDAPVAIRALKRFVTERFGVENLRSCIISQEMRPPVPPANGKPVAVIGAGPAGMCCAHDLALRGYPVTVFEKYHCPGGMLVQGIPAYRLPRALIELEIQSILDLGVTLHAGMALGTDFSFDDLLAEGFQAIFLAVGAQKNKSFRIDGVRTRGVLPAIDFLQESNRGGRVDIGERIAVIGGGNVAFDVARTIVRMNGGPAENQAGRSLSSAAIYPDQLSSKSVEMIVRKSREAMVVHADEIQQAIEENVQIHNNLGPLRILARNGRVCGVEVQSVKPNPHPRGNSRYIPISGTEHILAADTVIVAIGQSPDLDFLNGHDDIALDSDGTIRVDPTTLETSRPGVFAGGDAAFGPRNVISAVADGRRAARAIDEYLSAKISPFHRPAGNRPLASAGPIHPEVIQIPRQAVPRLPIDARDASIPVELVYSERVARTEAARCLHCWEIPYYDGDAESGTHCILCGGCVDICPENCLHILQWDEDGATYRDADREFGHAIEPDFRRPAAALLYYSGDRCIHCGLCALRCPVGAITMQEIVDNMQATLD